MAMFGAKRKKDEPKQKKKWQVELSDDEKDNATNDNMVCVGACKGERDSDLFCVTCKSYYCFDDFVKAHKIIEETKREELEIKQKLLEDEFLKKISAPLEPPAPTTEGDIPPPIPGPQEEQLRELEDMKEQHFKELCTENRKAAHMYRGLMGTDKEKLEDLDFGRLSGQDLCQWEKKEDKRRKEALELDLKRKRDTEDAESAKRVKQDDDDGTGVKDPEAGEDYDPTNPGSEGEDGEDKGELKKEENDRSVFVSNIAWEAKTSDVRSYFRQCGRIVEVTFPKATAQQRTSPHRGLAIIEFDTAEGAAAAMQLNATQFFNRPIRVIRHQVVAVPQDPDRRPTPFKVKMCHHFERGSCHKGDDCSFAHHPRELPPSAREMLARSRAAAQAVATAAPVPAYKAFRGGKIRGRGGGVDGGYKW